jgi:cell division septation protein DedD
MQRNYKEGLTVRQMIVFFMAGVAVCAVFFALGFVVGYNNQRPAGASTETENVNGGSATIPPTVNAPLEKDQAPAAAKNPPAANSAEPQTEQVSVPGPAAEPASAPGREAKPSGASPVSGGEPRARVESSISLQVVASSSRKDAENLVTTLKARGYPAFLATPQDAHASDNFFRVEVGPFSTRQEAEKARKHLSDDGFKPFLRR